jgi:predicted  nucleic acid-binding Zn-ribbon protein
MRQQEAPASDQKPDANAQRGDIEPQMIEARQVVQEYITQQRELTRKLASRLLN